MTLAAVFQALSRVQLFATPWTAAHQAPVSFTISWSLFKLMSIESVMLPSHLIFCPRLLLLPSVFPSIRVFSIESALRIRWPKNWSFSMSPSTEYRWLISFGIDWFDLLAIQGTLKSLLQHHSSKASIFWHSAFFRRRQWQPTSVLLPGISCGLRSPVGCSPWGREKSGTTDRLHFHFSLSCIGEGSGNPLQCSCLENPRDGGAWWAAVYGVAQSWTRLT